MRPLLNLFVVMVITAVASISATADAAPGAAIVGTVTLTNADGGTFPGDGARVTLACAADDTTRTAVSDEDGTFRFPDLPLDACSIEADVQGFAGPPVRIVTVANQVVEAYLHLGLASLRAGVNVGGTASLLERQVPRRCRRPQAGRRLEPSAKRSTGRFGSDEVGYVSKESDRDVTSND